jgi:SOS regulatory protein LexA
MNNPQKDFGNYLKNLRMDKKLSIRKLEELSGVSNAYLSQMENGKRGMPSPEILKKLHEPLDVSYDKLMEMAGHISSSTRSELLPETKSALERHHGISELFLNAAELFVSSVTDEKGLLKEEYKEFVLQQAENLYPDSKEDVSKAINNHLTLHEIFTNLSVEEKVNFINMIISDLVERNIDPNELLKEKNTNNFSVLRVPVLGYIAAGSPIFADEHITEYTEIPNLWSLREREVFILKVKGDSMIGSRIFDGDKVVVKIQPNVENGEIAVVNVNGDEATLKRVKKTENGQVILYPDNPKYDPTFITNENARIVGKVIQVMFEP